MGLGPPSLVIDTLKRYEAAGVTDLCIRFAGSDQSAQLEHFIDAVVPVLVRDLKLLEAIARLGGLFAISRWPMRKKHEPTSLFCMDVPPWPRVEG